MHEVELATRVLNALHQISADRGGHELSITSGQELEIINVKLENKGVRKRQTKRSH